MAAAGRRVLSYSDSLAAPTGDVDHEAPLPSLAASSSPASITRRRRGPRASAETQAMQPSYVPPSVQHQQLQTQQQPPPWLFGPPPAPPLYTGPPPNPNAVPLQPAPYPYVQQHAYTQAGPSTYHMPPTQPPFPQQPHLYSGPPPPQAPYPQQIGPPNTFYHPNPIQPHPMSFLASASASPVPAPLKAQAIPFNPSPQPPAIRTPWPHSDYYAWTTVVIDVDESSDEDDDSSSPSGSSSSTPSSSSSHANRAALSRAKRKRQTIDLVDVRRKLLDGASSSKGKIKEIDASSAWTTPPDASLRSSPAIEGADEIGQGTATSSTSLGEYERKQAEIQAMLEKIRKHNEAKARKKALATLEASRGERGQTETDAIGEEAALADESLVAEAGAAPPLNSEGQEWAIRMTTQNEEEGSAAAAAADQLAQQRARLLASMARGKKRKAEEAAAASASASAEASTTTIASADETQDDSSTEQATTTTQAEVEDDDTASVAHVETAPSTKRQRRKEKRRKEKRERQEHLETEREAVAAGDG